MHKSLRYTLTLMILLLSGIFADGSDTLSIPRLHHEVTFAASAGYNLPSHGYYRGYNEYSRPIPANSSLHLEYAFGLTSATRLGRLYPGVTQGLGFAASTFYDHSLMGTPIFAYIFQNARILDLNPCLGLNYSWNLGASYGWKENDVTASSWNVYVNVGLWLSWDISKLLTLNLGPEFTHCSNGDTAYPNGGANLMNLRVGLTGHITDSPRFEDRTDILEYESALRQKTFAGRMSYDLILAGGWRAGKVTGEAYALINRPFPFFALNLVPQYHLNRYFAVGASLDLLADRSADIHDVIVDPKTREVLSYAQPPLHRQMAAGLSFRGDIKMPIFTVGLGLGGFVLGGGKSLKGLYTMFTLKTFVTDRLFLNVTYRLSSRNYTHNLMYGLGWRFSSAICLSSRKAGRN